MTSREFFIYTLRDELPRFKRVFEALPEAKLDYRPHEKQKSALEMIQLFGLEPGMIVEIASKGFIDMASFKPEVNAATPKEVSIAFENAFNELIRLSEGSSEEEWDKEAEMRAGEKVEWAAPRGAMLWALLLDLIHHRGQISTYIRPMGGRVPSIYGPSGDSAENGM